MSFLLLLYDTAEGDLALDLSQFLHELGVEVRMIPLAENRGRTLSGKEQASFAEAGGAIFLVTPGAERRGRKYPSPSLAQEMGMARERFRERPEAIIYLVESSCTLPAIEQAAYISFDRCDMRSVVRAITLLLRELRTDGLGRPGIRLSGATAGDAGASGGGLASPVREVCREISRMPGGIVGFLALDKILATKFKMGRLEARLTLEDLKSHGLIIYERQASGGVAYWRLTELGHHVAQREDDRLQ